MTVESTVYTTLKADSTYNGLITGGLWPLVLPDDVDLPAGTYEIIDIVMLGSNSVGRARIQVNSFASSIATARSMRDALIDIAGAQDWAFEVGPEIWDDEGGFFYIPVDLLFTQGV